MHPLLARLDQWLAANRTAYHSGLMPGASEANIDEVARRVSGELPPLLRELLTWRNGQSADYEGVLKSPWSLMSTKDIASTMDEMAWLVENDDFADFWGTDWVPFLGSICGDHMCIDLQAAFGGEPGQIVYYSSEGVRHIAYPSLEAWLETFVVALETGMFGDSGEDCWEPVDWASYEAFVAERHPGYPIELSIPDYRDDSRSDAIEEFHQLAYAVDPGRLRAVLRDAGLDNGVVDGAFDRLTDIRTRGEITGEK
ncbi:SMI1/KNR4 family protein [Nocardia sp. NPDC005366]|uniref:SMI1/KNR4 family protein n=1 Tax=Nocardia sp. NPDC005366 TaxID=3156878 RepID=UPI0033A50F5B